MFTDVYSHILDEDRVANAQYFEEAFYGGKGKDPTDPHEPEQAEKAVQAEKTAKASKESDM